MKERMGMGSCGTMTVVQDVQTEVCWGDREKGICMIPLSWSLKTALKQRTE